MDCDEIYVSLLFPPSDYVSGISVFKRIINNKKPADVLHLNVSSPDGEIHNFDDYINERIHIDLDCELDTPSCIVNSLKKALDSLKKDYKKIYSRSWVANNHFIALEYKLLNQEVFWTAEFSDPLILNISNKVRNSKKFNLNDQKYIDHINQHIIELNKKNGASYPLVENNSSVFFMAEYLTYLFSDKIIFTNENQREVMLSQFSQDIRQLVIEKSEIQMHATLDEEFYYLEDAKLDLEGSNINIAYFGRDYYSQRHFESLFYALDSLNHKFKDKLRIYFFIDDDKLIKKLIRPLKSHENFVFKKPLDYFKFLNATTQFDVLIVNDVMTRDVWPINPYLPSKLSDYLGSSRDIWALYEDGSTLSKFDLRYKSDIADFASCRNQLIEIFKDNGFDDNDYSVEEEYLLQRLTTLNNLFEKEFNSNLKLKKENDSLKNDLDEVISSNSWKLTRPLRNLRSKK